MAISFNVLPQHLPGQAEGVSGEDEAPAEAGRGEGAGVEGEL